MNNGLSQVYSALTAANAPTFGQRPWLFRRDLDRQVSAPWLSSNS